MRNKRLFWIAFLIANIFLSSYYIDLWTTNANTASRALAIIGYYESGTFKIDKYHHLTKDKSYIKGHYYSDKAPLPAFLVLPFFGLSKALGIAKEVNGSLYGKYIIGLGGFICGTLPFVIIGFLSFIQLSKKKENVSGISPVLLSMLPFYGSFLFVFSGTFFNHLLSSAFLLASYMFLKERKYFWSGLFAGLSFLSEYMVAVIILVWVVHVLLKEKSWQKAWAFCLGVFPAIVVIMLYNYLFTDSPLIILYKYHTFQDLHTNYGFSFPRAESLWGLTFSSYKGLFFYAPFLFLCLCYAFVELYRRQNLKETTAIFLKNALIIPAVLILSLVSSYFSWWGGWSYGPRHLTFIAALLLYEGMLFLSRHKFSKIFFFTLSILGLLCAFAAKATVVYSVSTEVKNPLWEYILPNFINGNFNPNNLLTILWNIPTSVAAVGFPIIFILIITILTIWYAEKRFVFPWQT